MSKCCEALTTSKTSQWVCRFNRATLFRGWVGSSSIFWGITFSIRMSSRISFEAGLGLTTCLDTGALDDSGASPKVPKIPDCISAPHITIAITTRTVPSMVFGSRSSTLGTGAAAVCSFPTLAGGDDSQPKTAHRSLFSRKHSVWYAVQQRVQNVRARAFNGPLHTGHNPS